jgi:hygromycin-B 4-O-kinase
MIVQMSTKKTQINHEVAEAFAQQHFGVPELSLKRIADGELAQAFLFDLPDGPKVLRVRTGDNSGFLKDRFAHNHFNSTSIPVPKILEIGEIEDGLFYAVSERAPGKPLDKFTHAEMDKLMPELISTLDAIHATRPTGDGAGNWDADGTGSFNSWRESVESNLHLDDDETTAAAFYDHDLANGVREDINALLNFVPADLGLIHGDYGFNNALSDGNTITGVIDWDHSAYGDFLFDVAWLDFWVDKQGYAEAFKKHYVEQGREVSHFDERITCYKLLIGLGSLGFFARSRQAGKYEFAKQVIARIRKPEKEI